MKNLPSFLSSLAGGLRRGGPAFRGPDPTPEERERSRGLLRGYAPKVSVVVASYNYAGVLRETLDSVAAQTYGDFEALVVDDGSTDGSVEIIREYAAKDGRFRLLQHEGGVNKGLPATLQLGIEAATGEFVAFCESDDLWAPEHLEKKIELLREHWGEPSFIINDFETFGDAGRCKEVAKWTKAYAPVLGRERNRISPAEFQEHNWICTFSICMVRRSVLLGCDLLSVPQPSNLDWWLWRQVCFDHDVWCVHEKLTKWRLHKSSYLMRDDTPDRMAEHYDNLAKMNLFLARRHPAWADDLRGRIRAEDRFDCRDGRLSVAGMETEQPGFSVILAADGPEEAVRRSLGSIARQTYAGYELIPACGTGGVAPDRGRVEGWVEEAGLRDKTRFAGGGGLPTMEDAFDAAEKDWVAGLLPGDELRPDALQVLAARIVLAPASEGFPATGRVLRSGHVSMGSYRTTPLSRFLAWPRRAGIRRKA